MYLLNPFTVQNKNKTWEQTHSYEDIPFLGQNDQITPPPPQKKKKKKIQKKH